MSYVNVYINLSSHKIPLIIFANNIPIIRLSNLNLCLFNNFTLRL